MRRFLAIVVLLVPICAAALPEAPAVKWSDEGSSDAVVVPLIENREYDRVRITEMTSYIRYLFEHKQAVLLPDGTDPYFFFAHNNNATPASVNTVIFRESQMMNPASWIVQNVFQWSGAGTLRYVCPSAYHDGSLWYPQVTLNCYGPPSYEAFLYDEGAIGAGIWTNPFPITGPVYDYYLPLTDTGPGNVVYMDGQARDAAEDTHVFKSFSGVDATMLDPPGEVRIFPSDLGWGPNPVYGQGYENSQLVYSGDRNGTIVIALGGYRAEAYTDPTNPLLPVFRSSTDGGLTWSENVWLDQTTVPDMPGGHTGIAGHYSNSFFDFSFDGMGHMHFLAVLVDSGCYSNTAYVHGLYDIRETDTGWTATQVTNGIYAWFDPRALFGGDSRMHSPSLALGPDGTLIAAWNDVTDTLSSSAYMGILMSYSHDCGATWADPIKVAGQAGVGEYFSRLVQSATYADGADSGYAYILTMPTSGSNGPLDMIKVPYPAPAQIEVSVQLVGGQIELTWSPVSQATSFWVFGAANDAHFVPGMAPGYEHRVAIVAPPATTWSSPAGVGDPESNWTYLVMAVSAAEQALAISNRVGAHDYEADIP